MVLSRLYIFQSRMATLRRTFAHRTSHSAQVKNGEFSYIIIFPLVLLFGLFLIEIIQYETTPKLLSSADFVSACMTTNIFDPSLL